MAFYIPMAPMVSTAPAIVSMSKNSGNGDDNMHAPHSMRLPRRDLSSPSRMPVAHAKPHGVIPIA